MTKPLMKISDDPIEGYWPVFQGESFDILLQNDTRDCYAWANPEKVTKALQKKRLHGMKLARSPFR